LLGLSNLVYSEGRKGPPRKASRGPELCSAVLTSIHYQTIVEQIGSAFASKDWLSLSKHLSSLSKVQPPKPDLPFIDFLITMAPILSLSPDRDAQVCRQNLDATLEQFIPRLEAAIDEINSFDRRSTMILAPAVPYQNRIEEIRHRETFAFSEANSILLLNSLREDLGKILKSRARATKLPESVRERRAWVKNLSEESINVAYREWIHLQKLNVGGDLRTDIQAVDEKVSLIARRFVAQVYFLFKPVAIIDPNSGKEDITAHLEVLASLHKQVLQKLLINPMEGKTGSAYHPGAPELGFIADGPSMEATPSQLSDAERSEAFHNELMALIRQIPKVGVEQRAGIVNQLSELLNSAKDQLIDVQLDSLLNLTMELEAFEVMAILESHR
jgi:hypothetical protein